MSYYVTQLGRQVFQLRISRACLNTWTVDIDSLSHVGDEGVVRGPGCVR